LLRRLVAQRREHLQRVADVDPHAIHVVIARPPRKRVA
jgi:hypothetical protein